MLDLEFSHGPEIKIPGPIISIRGCPIFIRWMLFAAPVREGKTHVQAGLLTFPPLRQPSHRDSSQQWFARAEEVFPLFLMEQRQVHSGGPVPDFNGVPC